MTIRSALWGILLTVFTGIAVLLPRPAFALCEGCACLIPFEATVRTAESTPHPTLRNQINREFRDLQRWLLEEVWLKEIMPQLPRMTEQLSAYAIQQMIILGAFFDAKSSLESQRLMRYLVTEAHRDYYPSEGVCTLGSTVQSVIAPDRRHSATSLILTKRSLNRQLGNVNSSGAPARSDQAIRFEDYREDYCDPNDNNHDLVAICRNAPAQRRNKDIDFARTIGFPQTLDIDFTNNNLTADEQDIMALQSNLFGHDVFPQKSAAALRGAGDIANLYDMRALAAKRSIALQSFNAIAAMKTPADTQNNTPAANSIQYIRALMGELGIPQADINRLVGANPSYYAQMKLLTQRTFQRPEFFVDLYDKPANVARKAVALESLKLIQERDIFESYLRTEAMLSIILELAVAKEQRNVQNKVNRVLQQGYER